MKRIEEPDGVADELTLSSTESYVVTVEDCTEILGKTELGEYHGKEIILVVENEGCSLYKSREDRAGRKM